MEINTETKIYGIIGDPIEHSRSPEMQNQFLQNAKINAVYLAFHITPENLPNVMTGFRHLKELQGFNVTVPHKKEIIKYIDQIDPVAKKIGAVNTVVINKDGIWTGYNTDWYGVEKTLEKNKIFRHVSVLIIGAGGATNGVIYALKKYGISQITLTNRTMEKAKSIAKLFHVNTIDFTSFHNELEKYQLIINTTTIAFSKLIPEFQKNTIYFDLKYYLETTPNSCIDGKTMLYYQGVRSFELWTGKKIEE